MDNISVTVSFKKTSQFEFLDQIQRHIVFLKDGVAIMLEMIYGYAHCLEIEKMTGTRLKKLLGGGVINIIN